MPTTEATESRKPTSPAQEGMARHMRHETAHADERACDLLPRAHDPVAASDMAQDLTAEAGAPLKATKAPVTNASRTSRARCESPVARSADPSSAEMRERCEPETAIRWAAPQEAKSSSSGLPARPTFEPQTIPAMRPRSSDEAGDMRPTTSARTRASAPSGPDAHGASPTRTMRAVPTTPCMRMRAAHSPSSPAAKRPTPCTTCPAETSSGSSSHTTAEGCPAQEASALHRQP